MRILTRGCLILLLATLMPACTSTRPSEASAPADLTELTQPACLQMVMRYLYRWQLDESEFEELFAHKKVVFWIRPLTLKLDPGDHSQFAEIFVPQAGMSLRMKKADYTIAEIATQVKSQHFKISRVSEGDVPRRRPRDSTLVAMDTQEIRDFLFRTRFQLDRFDPAIVEHLRQVAQDQAAKEGLSATNILGGQQIIDIAPVSPVANETWLYWEVRRKLFYISSDIDLADPAVWKYQTLTTRSFDLDKQVVISHEEATGSNFYMTRHLVSRVLFNCIVLGQRIDVPPAPAVGK